MDTDSNTTARVDDDEMLKTDGGWFGAAATWVDAANINPTDKAHNTRTRRSRTAKALLIGVALSFQPSVE
jgi:hypothetical protein